jgi:hypothetical protein
MRDTWHANRIQAGRIENMVARFERSPPCSLHPPLRRVHG